MAQRLRYTELAPAGTAALRAMEHYCNAETCLAPVLLELVPMRASLLNGCAYCAAMHSHELEKHNEPERRITDVAAWRGSGAYTQRERAAFAWTEAVTNIQDGHASDEAYAGVREHFSDVETVNLTIAITSINAWNSLAISFHAERRSKPTQEPIGDDGGKVEVED